jgi:pyridoxine/pyridoxamine 5'-phosphate oxidase
LLKAADERGFTFFSNYESRKGLELASNPYAALLFRTPDRQVRVEGRVERIPADESDAYWATRPAASRRSAAASHQSQPIDSRAELETAVAAQPVEPPRPRHWGGYRLTPEVYEFCTNVTCSGDARAPGRWYFCNREAAGRRNSRRRRHGSLWRRTGAPARSLSGLPDHQRLEHPGEHAAGGHGLGDDHRRDR